MKAWSRQVLEEFLDTGHIRSIAGALCLRLRDLLGATEPGRLEATERLQQSQLRRALHDRVQHVHPEDSEQLARRPRG